MQLPSMKMFLLDVKYNPWRTEAVTKRFEEAGLEVERFVGIHGQAVGIVPVNTVFDVEKEHAYRINPGKLSITPNKWCLFKIAVREKEDIILIFENDVTFCPNFKEELAKSMAALPADWEVVSVGHCCTDKKPRTIINERVHEVHWPLCCHAMMWKRSALQKAIDVIDSADWGTPSDIILQHKVYPLLRHYCLVPALAFTDQTPGEAGNTVLYTDVQGWCTPDILRIYDEQLTGFGMNKAVMVELGSWKGRSAIYAASEIKRRHKNVRFVCVDTWEGNADEPDMAALIVDANNRGGLYKEFVENINRCGVADYIKPLRMTTVEGAKQFADRSVDFIYIDAGHSYENVTQDLEAWYAKLKPGASCAGHDIARDSVRRAVKDFCRKIGKTHREYEESFIIDACHV